MTLPAAKNAVACVECGCCLETGETGDLCGNAWNTRIEAAQVVDEVALTKWLEREMPPGTVISSPRWWAKRITRALTAALGGGK